jgi:hypothetical protein
MQYKINDTYIPLRGCRIEKSKPVSICLDLRQG